MKQTDSKAECNIENMHNWNFEKTKIFVANSTKSSYNIEYMKVSLLFIIRRKDDYI